MTDMLQPRPPQDDARTALNLGAGLAGAFAISVEVVLHRHFGPRYFGLRAVAPLVLIPMFGVLFFPHDNQMPLMVFLLLYLLAGASARGEALRLRHKGVIVHTLYNGFPRCLKLSASGEQEARVKTLGEPFLVGLWGTLIYNAWNAPLGAYLIVAAISLAVTNRMYQMKTERQVDDLSDAMIENEMRMAQFRDLHSRRS